MTYELKPISGPSRTEYLITFDGQTVAHVYKLADAEAILEGLQPAAVSADAVEALSLADTVIRNHATGRCDVDERTLKVCVEFVKLVRKIDIYQSTCALSPETVSGGE